MIRIIKKENCCGCESCASICPTNAISMITDEEGFLYPSINKDKCINCDLCNKVCPIVNKPKVKHMPEGLIIRSKDYQILFESTSGGAFTVLADYVLDNQGVVYGAGYDSSMKVICKKTTTYSGLTEMRGSKFVQSQIGNSFISIKKELENGVLVLFSGTPCQVAGLINYLKGKPDNLICVDFVCRGVPSPKLWENYIHTMETKYKSKIIGARFKHKTYGYHASTMKITFSNGQIYFGSGRVDPYLKAFVREMSSRPSCSKCAFKGVERPSDITIFDCYEYSRITGEKDDDKGYSSLLVHTKLGKKVLSEISDSIIIKTVEIDELISNNGVMVYSSAMPNKKRDKFYKLVSSISIDKAMQKIEPITTKDKLVEKTKVLLFKTRLIMIIRRLKKRRSIEISD